MMTPDRIERCPDLTDGGSPYGRDTHRGRIGFARVIRSRDGPACSCDVFAGTGEVQGPAIVAGRLPSVALGVADRVGAIEVLDDQPADAVCGTVDSDVHVGADALDKYEGRFEQVDLDAAVLVDPPRDPFSSPIRTATRWMRSPLWLRTKPSWLRTCSTSARVTVNP